MHWRQLSAEPTSGIGGDENGKYLGTSCEPGWIYVAVKNLSSNPDTKLWSSIV